MDTKLMPEKFKLCKWLFKNTDIPMRVLSKKSVNYLRALKDWVETDQRKTNFKRDQGYMN